jgi:predicted nucleic acid-binding protein
VRTSIPCSTRIPSLVHEDRHHRGLLDTSVVVDLQLLQREQLPLEPSISAVTLAELAAGPHAAADAGERARRQDVLQRVEASFEPLPLDRSVARAYGRLYGTVFASGRRARGRHALDLLIAATALANSLPLYTRNPGDVEPIGSLVDVVVV